MNPESEYWLDWFYPAFDPTQRLRELMAQIVAKQSANPGEQQ